MNGPGKNILLVEDEALLALSKKQDIENNGFAVFIVYSGRQALDYIAGPHGTEVDLILMDVDLGDVFDGPEAARRILEIRKLPIVFLTSHAEKEIVEKVKDITCYGYVLKQSGDFVLLESIAMALRLFRADTLRKAEEERFRTVASNTNDVIYDWDLTSGRLQWFGNVEGFFENTAPPQSIQEYLALLHPEDKNFVIEVSKNGLKGETAWYGEYRILINDIEKVVLGSGQALYEEQPEPLKVVGSVKDITEKRRVEEQLALQSKIVDQVSDAIITTDLDLQVTSWNKAAEELYGRTEQEALGRNVDELLHTRFLHESQQDAQSVLAETGIWKGELQQYTKERKKIYIEAVVTWIKDTEGNITGGATVNRDITEQYFYRQLRELQQKMALEISQTDSLEQSLALLLDYCMGLDEIDYSGVYIRDGSVDTFELIAHRGISEAFVSAQERFPADSVVFQKTAGTGKPIYCLLSDLFGEELRQNYPETVNAVAILPFVSDGDVFGVLNLGSSTHNTFPLTTRYALESIATWLGNIIRKKQAEHRLHETQKELQKKTEDLQVSNTALKVLITHIKEEPNKQIHTLYDRLNTLVLPFVEKLKGLLDDRNAKQLAEALQMNLSTVLQYSTTGITVPLNNLTPREQQVVSLVQGNKTSKEIAETLCLSKDAVDFHRKQIRKKLGITGKKTNLASALRGKR